MAFQVKASGLPIGSYNCRFTRWEESVHEQYGPRAQFVFTVTDGQHKGGETSRFTSATMSPKSALFKIAKGLAGRAFDIGETFDPDQYVGKEYLVIVGETESGATRVEHVTPATAPAAAAPVAAAAGAPAFDDNGTF